MYLTASLSNTTFNTLTFTPQTVLYLQVKLFLTMCGTFLEWFRKLENDEVFYVVFIYSL